MTAVLGRSIVKTCWHHQQTARRLYASTLHLDRSNAAGGVMLCGTTARQRLFSSFAQQIKQHRIQAQQQEEKAIISDEHPVPDYKQVFGQWFVGMCVATPLIAIIQGVLLLTEYRANHGDAPRPVMPMRGVVVVQGDDKDNAIDNSNGEETEQQQNLTGINLLLATSNLFQQNKNNSKKTTATTAASNLPPLHLLVVGDSLAAGVGMSESGTPVLPESIARALSKAFHGRIVYWTCIGTPGTCASQIVHDINMISTQTSTTEKSKIELLLQEWQAKRKEWQARREMKRRKTAAQQQIILNDNSSKIKNGDDGDDENNTKKEYPNRVIRFWNEQVVKRYQQRRKNQQEIPDANNIELPNKKFKKWWNHIQNSVKEDFEDIKDIVQHPQSIHHNQESDNTSIEISSLDKSSTSTSSVDATDPVAVLEQKINVPEIVSQPYDIAVVLTGLNDLKHGFMPFMMLGANAQNENSSSKSNKLRNDFFNILEALRQKMVTTIQPKTENNNNNNNNTIDSKEHHGNNAVTIKNVDDDLIDDDNNDEFKRGNENIDQQQQNNVNDHHYHYQHHRSPLIVVPALPVMPLPLFQLAPIKWFAIPIFQYMEDNKFYLAKKFPNHVLFVDQPSLNDWIQLEEGKSELDDLFRREQILVRITDATKQARERIVNLMKKHYYKYKGGEEQQCDDGDQKRVDDYDIMQQQQQGHYDKDNSNNQQQQEHSIGGQTQQDHKRKNSNNTSETSTSKSTGNPHYNEYRNDHQAHFDHHPSSSLLRDDYYSSAPGSTFIAADKMHPNDSGYEVWGRHIAAAIVKRWKDQERLLQEQEQQNTKIN